jgi:predicted ATP-grasp superfamily ATP-dependent carboligase
VGRHMYAGYLPAKIEICCFKSVKTHPQAIHTGRDRRKVVKCPSRYPIFSLRSSTDNAGHITWCVLSTHEMCASRNHQPSAGHLSVREATERSDLSGRSDNVAEAQRKDIAGLRVLISDEHYKHTLAIVRRLGQKGAQVCVVAGSKDSLACRSRYCSKVIPSPASTLDALVETLLATVKREHFDLLMPVSYPLTVVLAKRRADFVPFTRLELAESEAIELASNKEKMLHLATEVGVPVPQTFTPVEMESRAREIQFPVVVKPGKESPGRAPVRYANNLEQLRKIFSAGSAFRSGYAGDGFLIQEFIPGHGCGFFATYQHGFCKRVFMHRRVREYPASGGASTCAESFYDEKLERHGRRMLDALDWHGIAMVEFRFDTRDGEYKLMEINPKFWGSLDLALAAHADFPGDLCQMALDVALPFEGNYRRDLRFHWPFSDRGDLFHLWTRPQSILQVGVDFLNPQVQSNVWLGDLAPNTQELRNLAGHLIRGRKR